jgi:hypothetical protein
MTAYLRRYWPVLIGLAMIPLNTDALIPFLRGFFRGSVLATVLGVSILANAKVIIAYWGVGRSSECAKPQVTNRFLVWTHSCIERWTIPTIAVLTLLPIPGFRSLCTAWCSATQSPQGLAALLIANPVHVWSLVLGWDLILNSSELLALLR